MHMVPYIQGGSDSEGSFHFLPSLRLAAKRREGNREGVMGWAGKRLQSFMTSREWQVSCNCSELRGC